MNEKDITADMARATIAMQSNEDEITAVFRLHIMRFWSRERIVNFCLHLLAVDLQEWIAWRKAVESKRAAGESKFCSECHALLEERSVYCDTCGADQ